MTTNPALYAASGTPLLLAVPDVARLLGLGRSTVYELVNAGRLPLVHVGRSARVPRAAVEAFVSQLTATEVRPS